MEKKEYEKIILKGLNDPIQRKKFGVYLDRTFHKLEKKGIPRKEFIQYCEIIVNEIEQSYFEQLALRIAPIENDLVKAREQGNKELEKLKSRELDKIKRFGIIQIEGVQPGMSRTQIDDLQKAIDNFRGIHPEMIIWGLTDVLSDFDKAYSIRLNSYLQKNNNSTETDFKRYERKKARELQNKYFFDKGNEVHRKYYDLLKEWRRFVKDNKEDNSSPEKIKLTVEDCALAYYIEQNAKGKIPIPASLQSEVKRKGEQYLKQKKDVKGKSGSTFAKKYREVYAIDHNRENDLNAKFGDNWKEKVLILTDNNDKVANYLEKKYKRIGRNKGAPS